MGGLSRGKIALSLSPFFLALSYLDSLYLNLLGSYVARLSEISTETFFRYEVRQIQIVARSC